MRQELIAHLYCLNRRTALGTRRRGGVWRFQCELCRNCSSHQVLVVILFPCESSSCTQDCVFPTSDTACKHGSRKPHVSIFFSQNLFFSEPFFFFFSEPFFFSQNRFFFLRTPSVFPETPLSSQKPFSPLSSPQNPLLSPPLKTSLSLFLPKKTLSLSPHQKKLSLSRHPKTPSLSPLLKNHLSLLKPLLSLPKPLLSLPKPSPPRQNLSSCEQYTLHVTFFSCLCALVMMSHTTLAQVFVRVISSMCHAPECLISLRPSLRTLHLSLPSSTSSS